MTEEEALNLMPGALVRLVGNNLTLDKDDKDFTQGKIYTVVSIDDDLWINHITDNGSTINGFKYIHYEVVQNTTVSKSQKQHIINLINSI